MKVALITGGSAGFGRALAEVLADRGWSLVLDGRDPDRLEGAVEQLRKATTVRAVAGDVSLASHRAALSAAVAELGGLDLLVNNASTLGVSPLQNLSQLSLETFQNILDVNVVAPLALAQLFLDDLKGRDGAIINVTSDAGIEPYETWGGYGSSKAALEHLSAIMAVEQPALRIYWVDPGDMRTQMHQDAFPGEDISDRPLPEAVVPGFMALIDHAMPSGRYRATELVAKIAQVRP